ncbi:methyltransferase (plasmid) [Streptomyces sp. BI20]|uniref:methyltransferase n=1 Tax=Streptomyces sp. BI20 TaxID=3403460 RepID=UPI003C78B7A2
MTLRPDSTHHTPSPLAGDLSDGSWLRVLVHGATAFALLDAGVRSSLFEYLELTPDAEPETIAKALDLEPQPTRVLLLGLTSLRLLHKDGSRYRNTEIVRRKLLAASPEYLGPLIRMQSEVINPAMPDLLESLRDNTNTGLRRLSGGGDTLYARLVEHPELQQLFYDNMGDASRKTFRFALDAFDFTRLTHVVDLGGGDATNAIELARRFGHLRVTVFDQPEVLPIARRNIERAGLADRIDTVAGDLFATEFPTGVDGFLYFHIHEIWSAERNTALLRKCHEALAPGGAAIVYNFVADDDERGPLIAGFLSAYFLGLASGEGMTYTARDMAEHLVDAGFTRTETVPDLPFNHALVAGFKGRRRA